MQILNFKEFLEEAKFKKVNRVRGGKIQRRKKVSDKKGYKMVDGKSVRMSAKEKRNRKLAQKKGARKRKATQSRSNRKRRISNRKRSRLGN